MEKTYTISQVSQILDIPIDTIRFYQKQGIVNPSRNDKNGYHYYTADDIDLLLLYKKHRAMDYSAKEIQSISTEDGYEEYVERCKLQQEQIRRQKEWYAFLEIKNQNYINVLANIPNNLFSYTITTQPEAYYFINCVNEDFLSTALLEGAFEEWMKFYPFVENYYSLRLDESVGESYICKRGFTIKKYWADRLNIKLPDNVYKTPERQAVYTVVETINERMFSPELFSGALAFIEKNNLEVIDAMQGNVLTRFKEKDRVVRHMEVWIPVKKRI